MPVYEAPRHRVTRRILDAAIEQLFNEEKHAKLDGYVAVTEILWLCFEARAWKTLNDLIVLLPKRRGQLQQEAEKHLSDMVVSNALAAKIDRPMGIVCFQRAKDSNDFLNSWAENLERLLDLVEKSCHQIHKETVVHIAVLKV